MNYCVLVRVSKHALTFWYRSGDQAYAPLLIRNVNETPLYFYVSGNDFLIGQPAREKFHQHDPDAYGDYFEIIKDPGRHFTIYGQKKPVKQLLYYAIEQQLSHFLNTVLYKGESIESFRQQFPLRFLFNADIEDQEKALVENLFAEAGYYNTGRVDHDASLFDAMEQMQLISKGQSILLFNSLDGILYIRFYRKTTEPALSTLKLEGQGADPRVQILADMIIEYITAQNSYLNIDKAKERQALLPFAAGLLKQAAPIIQGEAELADGHSYWYKVKEKTLLERLQYHTNDLFMYHAVDGLLSEHQTDAKQAVIILASEEIKTEYFLNKLLKKYPNVAMAEDAHLKETLRLIFEKAAAQNYRPAVAAPVPALPQLPMAPPPVLPLPIRTPPPPLPPKRVTEGAPTTLPPNSKPPLPAPKPPVPGNIPPAKPPLPPGKAKH